MKPAGFFLVGMALITAGCGKGTGGSAANDPAFYALTVKQDIYEFVRDARRDVRNAHELGTVLLEKLEVYETQPVGEHKDIHRQLFEKCKEFVAVARSTSSPTFQQKLREMEALANKLPGQVDKTP